MKPGYIAALLRQAMSAAAHNRAMFAVLSLSMCLNNLMFFSLWIIFFSSVGQVKGWHLSEVALFQGIGVIAFGTAFFLGDGAIKIGKRILNGELDTFLVRPRNPLPQLITLESDPSCLGDVLYGAVLLVVFAHLTIPGFLLALSVSCLIAVLFIAMAVFFQSLAFFFNGGTALADQLMNMMLCIGFTPQHTQPMIVKFVMFTILPAGFMVIMPVEIVRHGSLALLAIMAAAVFAYLGLAVAFFQHGLRRYTSATGWQA